jgi:hypothetical protein
MNESQKLQWMRRYLFNSSMKTQFAVKSSLEMFYTLCKQNSKSQMLKFKWIFLALNLQFKRNYISFLNVEVHVNTERPLSNRINILL